MSGKNKILIVDDEESILKILTEICVREGYKVDLAKDGLEALDYLNNPSNEFPDLIVLDIMMPKLNGFDVASRIKSNPETKDIPIIFLTAYTDTENTVKAFQMGGADYISKPFNMYELLARVCTQLSIKNLIDELKFKNRILEDKNKERERMTFAMVSALENANFYNDTDTGNHIKRVSETCGILAEGYGCDVEFIKKIKIYASLHDIGKVGISEALLKKPGKYTPAEFDAMKKHVSIGAKMLSSPEIDKIAVNIAKYHHEKWDGSGYLEGLKGEEIPLEARIVAIADVYDALITKRVYKGAFTEEKADEIIRADSGKHFDPKLVEIFFKNKKNIKELHSLLQDICDDLNDIDDINLKKESQA